MIFWGKKVRYMVPQDEKTDYYKILNVPRTVDDKHLYSAYTAVAKKYAVPPGAPLSVQNRLEAEFEIYQKAYNTLSNPENRRNYDLQLRILDIKKEQVYLEGEAEKEIERQKLQRQKKLEAERVVDLQTKSPIKNDPRLKDSLSGVMISQFKPVEIDNKKLDQIRSEREQKEKLKKDIIFAKAKKQYELGDFDTAIDVMRSLLDKYPKVAEFHSYIGLVLQAKGWIGYAQAEFKVALHFDPADEIALKNYKPSDKPSRTKEREEKPGFFSNLFRKK